MGDVDILGFGSSAVDDLIYVAGPLGAGKGRIVRRERDFGGNVATALVAAVRLGARAGFIGWLSDRPDEASAAELERQGVDVAQAPRRPDAGPIRSTIVVGSDGERFIAFDDGVPHGTSDTLPDAVLSSGRVLLIDGYAVNAVPVVERASRLGLAIVADIEWSRGAATEALLALADHLVLPLAFARSHTGADRPAAIVAALWSDNRAAVVLTDGGKGCHLRQRGDETLWHLPAHAVVPVDTTGAGDCFHGAYALALAEGQTPLDCARFASAAAAIAVTGHGGRGALPDRARCLALMGGSSAASPVKFGA